MNKLDNSVGLVIEKSFKEPNPFLLKSGLTLPGFEIVYETPAGVIGDAWTDFLPESSNLVADWTSPISCGNYNIKTGKCSGQNY